MGLMGLVISVSLMGAAVVAAAGSSGAGNRLTAAGDAEAGGCTAPSGGHCCPGLAGGGRNECSGMMNVPQKCPCVCTGVLPLCTDGCGRRLEAGCP